LQSELGTRVATGAKRVTKGIRIEKRKDRRIPSAEGYFLNVGSGGIEVVASSDAGIFYAIQTLSQLITANRTGRSIPCLTIIDYPDFPVRGWQDDISRGPIPTLDFLKRQVRTLAAYKLNAITLYTEHVFKLKKHPTLAPDEGITQEQIAELSAYAARYHVQVIGNFQSFGHMEKILSKPGYQHLAENGHILTPTKEESYRLMEEIYSEVVPAYSSPYFNINCDETFGLGEGLSKKMADSIGVEGIYGYHINRLNDLLKPYQKRILMWGDIAANPKIVAQLPEDITVISWGYHDAQSFDYAIKPFTSQGLNTWVAPGVSCWGNVFPNLKVANVNISNYIRDGFRLGATGVLNTTWDDDGMNFFENNWYGLVWGGEKSWNAPGSVALAPDGDAGLFGEAARQSGCSAFNEAFDRLFFGIKDRSVVDWMRSFSHLHQSKVRAIATHGRMFEPLMPFYPEYVGDNQTEWNAEVLLHLDSLEQLLPAIRKEVVRNALALEYLEYAIDLVRFTANKNMFRVDLYRYLNSLNGALAPESLKVTLKILIGESERLMARYEELWKHESRGWWLDHNLKKFGQLAQELREVRGLTILTVADVVENEGRRVEMKSIMDKMPVFYTLDGTLPTKQSARYAGPLYLKGNSTIRARVIAEGREFPESVDSLILHKAIGKLHRLNSSWSTYHPAYDAGGKLGLIDGRTGSVTDIRSGRWQGYSGQNIDIELDFGRIDTLNRFSMGFYQTTFSWVILPKQVDIYYSDDGVNYQKYISIKHDIPVDLPDAITHRFETSLNGLKTRFLKVIGVYYGPLPEWHSSRGEASMMFSDEIVVE
jgi:hexosaminidase